ncbi:MAG TPA: hypothetical protein VI036_17585 [Propionibacteriaceae bacterium]
MVSPLAQFLGGVAVAVGADVVGGAVVRGGVGAVVVAGAVAVVGPVVAGAVVVGAVVVGAVVVDWLVGDAVLVGVCVGVGVGLALPLWTLKRPRRVEVVPFAHVMTTLMVWVPSASFAVLYGRAVPSVAVPAKSKGAFLSVRTGGLFLHCGLSM